MQARRAFGVLECREGSGFRVWGVEGVGFRV